MRKSLKFNDFLSYMHDIILAKEIFETIKLISAKHNLKKINGVSVEIGDVSNIHRHEHGEHSHDIEIENLEFHLKNFLPDIKFQLARNKDLKGWKLVEIEGD